MKTNDIKITQRAEYYYTAIDLFQTVHQNRSVLGVLGCKADAQKLSRLLVCCLVVFFFNAGSSIFCQLEKVVALQDCSRAPCTCLSSCHHPLHGDHGFSSPLCTGILPRQKYIDEDFSLSG